MEDYGTGAIAEKVKKPLEGIKVACYYGCLMSRPADIMQFDDAENPMAMDNIMTALGAEVVPFPLKTECCGAAMGIPRRDITARLTGRILERAQAFGADAVVVACPLCHMNLDLRQRQSVGGSMKMPVLYFTQLMGLALGLPHQELGFGRSTPRRLPRPPRPRPMKPQRRPRHENRRFYLPLRIEHRRDRGLRQGR